MRTEAEGVASVPSRGNADMPANRQDGISIQVEVTSQDIRVCDYGLA